MTAHPEQAPQREAITDPTKGELPSWVARLFGAGLFAITAGWVYLLALGAGYLWDNIF